MNALASLVLVIAGGGAILLIFRSTMQALNLWPHSSVSFDLWPGETAKMYAVAQLQLADQPLSARRGHVCLTDLRLLWSPDWSGKTPDQVDEIEFRRTRLQNIEAYSAAGDVGFSFSAEGTDYLLLFSWGLGRWGDKRRAAAFLKALAKSTPEVKRDDSVN